MIATSPWFYVACALAGYVAIQLLLAVHNKFEKWRYIAIKLSIFLGKIGAKHAEGVALAWGAGDLSGCYVKAKDLLEHLSTEEGRVALFTEFAKNGIPEFLRDPTRHGIVITALQNAKGPGWRAWLQAELAKIEPPAVAAVVATAAPGVVAAAGPKPA